jgi:hypothetical protein
MRTEFASFGESKLSVICVEFVEMVRLFRLAEYYQAVSGAGRRLATVQKKFRDR